MPLLQAIDLDAQLTRESIDRFAAHQPKDDLLLAADGPAENFR
jgi:hypothetical protein